MKRVDLIIIDGQNDFLDPSGALYVQDADKEAVQLADMIDRLGSKITKIHATLDSHHPVDIAHPIMWKDENGNHPDPFTIITADEVRNRQWVCTLLGQFNRDKGISFQDKCLSYVEALEANNRYPLCIWPPHCLIGTPGHNVFPALAEAYQRWVDQNTKWINYVTKGEYPFTEHYSAIQADVPEPTRPETQINADLLKDVSGADEVVWTGWAGSHCLANTGRDAVNYFGDGKNEFIEKSVLLTDLCAPVQPDPPGTTMFTDMRDSFLQEMENRGMKLTTSDQYLT